MKPNRKPHIGAPGHVRIIGGSLRGSRLGVAAAPGLRPTPQRLRQTVFDWLAPDIRGARVLDAFAGTGALGIEALSRGAATATFFEHERTQAAAIAADLARLGHADGEVRCVDTLHVLASPPSRPYDIVFVDPPFEAGAWEAVAGLLQANAWLAPHASVYVEAGGRVAWRVPTAWRIHRERDAGAVHAALFRVVAAG